MRKLALFEFIARQYRYMCSLNDLRRMPVWVRADIGITDDQIEIIARQMSRQEKPQAAARKAAAGTWQRPADAHLATS